MCCKLFGRTHFIFWNYVLFQISLILVPTIFKSLIRFQKNSEWLSLCCTMTLFLSERFCILISSAVTLYFSSKTFVLSVKKITFIMERNTREVRKLFQNCKNLTVHLANRARLLEKIGKGNCTFFLKFVFSKRAISYYCT